MTESVGLVPQKAHDHAEALVKVVLAGQKAWVEAEEPDASPEALRNGAISVVFSLAMSHVISEVVTEAMSIDELIHILSISTQNFLTDLQENGYFGEMSIN